MITIINCSKKQLIVADNYTFYIIVLIVPMKDPLVE